MKKRNIRGLVVSLILVLVLTLGAGCALTPSVETSPPPSPPATENITPIDTEWSVTFPESQTPILPSIADVVDKVKPSVVAMTGTGTTFIGGYGHDQVLIKKMRERNGNVPTTTTSTSVIDAFNKMGIRKVSVAMPYLEDVSRAAVKFVEDSGFKVVTAKWLNKTGRAIQELSKETLYHLAREVDDPESEAVFISCTNLHTFEIIDKLECDLQKPVITSNQATIWNMLRLAGINDKIEGYGQLLSKY